MKSSSGRKPARTRPAYSARSSTRCRGVLHALPTARFSAPKPFTTRTPVTVSSTDGRHAGDSCCSPSTPGGSAWRTAWRARSAPGAEPSASSVSSTLMDQDHGRRRARRDGVGDRERDHHDEALDLLQVGVGPAHELTGLRLVVVREVQPLQVGEQLAAAGRSRPGRRCRRRRSAASPVQTPEMTATPTMARVQLRSAPGSSAWMPWSRP